MMPASPSAFHYTPPENGVRTAIHWPALSAVLLVHVLLLAWALLHRAPPPSAVMPPMVGVLIAPAASDGGKSQATSQHAEPAQAEKKQSPRTPSQEKAKPAPSNKAALPAAATAASGNTPATASGKGKADADSGTSGGAFFAPRVDAAHLNNPRPPYPAASRRMAEEGTVALSVHILADGRVAEVRLKQSSGYPRLDNAAIRAVKNWRYVPARRGDTPIPWWYTQAVHFSLTD